MIYIYIYILYIYLYIYIVQVENKFHKGPPYEIILGKNGGGWWVHFSVLRLSQQLQSTKNYEVAISDIMLTFI